METTIQPDAMNNVPGPETFAPAAPAAAPMTGSVSLVPPALLERITIGPPPSWVVVRDVDIEEAQKGGIDPGYLLDWQHHAGRGESCMRSVRRLGTMNAVHEASQWRVNIDPKTSRLTIHSLIVRRGDQVTDNAKPERLRVIQREQGLEYQVLSGLLTVVVLLEDVRVGDVLDVSYTIEYRGQIFPDHFSELFTLPYWTLRSLYWSVRFPTGRPMRWKSSDPKLEPSIREEGDETEWTWHQSRLPGCEPEPNVPGWYFEYPWIQVTDFPSWEAVASGLAAAWQEDLQNPEIRRLVDSISAQAATPALRAERALTHLQDEIRYLSIDSGLGGQVPASPSEVIKRGFGDCKDKSFAAAHLLRLLGIPARPVLVSTVRRQAVEQFLPTPNVFNHAIVEYEVEGRRRWVDVTIALQGGSLLSRTTPAFKLGLPIGPGVTELEEITSPRPTDYRELRETYHLDTSGRPSLLRVRVIARGREADLWRHSLTFEGETHFSRQREQFYQRLFSGAKRVGALEWHDDREHNELEIAEAFDVQDVVMPLQQGKIFYFRIWAHSIQGVLGFVEGEKRKHPWAMPFPCHQRHIVEIDSSGLPLDLIRTAKVDGKAFRFSAEIQQRQGFASITYDVEVLADQVSAADYETHKKKVREVWPYTIVNGHLPKGSMVPWKARSPQVMPLRRKSPPASPRSAPPPLPESIAPLNAPVDASASEVQPDIAPAPALAPAPPRDKSALGPRPEKARHEASEPATAREKIQRPNPPALSGTGPLERSRRPRSRRRQRNQRRELIMFACIFVGAAILLAMFIFLMNAK